VLLHGEVECLELNIDGATIDGDKVAFGVEWTGYLAELIEPGATVSALEANSERSEILSQCQLGEANLIVDLEPSRKNGDLD
jgi:hypothetical protein